MRLIDADALMQSLGITSMDCDKCAWYDKKWSRCKRGGDFEDACCAIENAPTIEIERKKGKWIMDENPHDGDCRCSNCFVAIDQMHERNHPVLNALTNGKWWTFYKFCPHCGADMRDN